MKIMPPEIKSLNLVVNFIKEGKHIIAYAPALDLSTVGKSEKEARKKFQEIVKIFFSDIQKRNVTKEVLTELGWKLIAAKSKNQWVPPRVKSMNVHVPVAA